MNALFKPHHWARRRAFTLIELLVVIAIIAILAAILFPVFMQAKKSAKTIVCLSNMRNVGLAVLLYIPDNDEICPPGFVADGDLPPKYTRFWIGYDNTNVTPLPYDIYGDMRKPAVNKPHEGLIDPYLKSHDVKKDPESRGQMTFAAPAWRKNGMLSPFSKGLVSTYIPSAGRELSSYVGAGFHQITHPADALMIFEHVEAMPLCSVTANIQYWANVGHMLGAGDTLSETGFKHMLAVHRNRLNTFWFDGHARTVHPGIFRKRHFQFNQGGD